MTEATQRHAPGTADRGAYSAIWTVANTQDLIRDVEGQFESWLRRKGRWDPPTETSGHHLGPDGQELLVVHRDRADGRSVRYRLIETNRSGRWRTSVTVNAPAVGQPWVGLIVSNDQGMPAKVPNLATFLLDALELRDGETWLSSVPFLASAADVERIAEEVTDLDRQGLYFVAGTDASMPLAPFSDRVTQWTLDTRGMAQVAVLDPAATAEFAKIMGPTHAVPPWTVRTFMTDVDPAVESDGRRHRILGTKRLAGSDGAVRSILGHAARTHAATRALPASFATIDRALVRAEDKLLVEGLFNAPAEVPREVPAAGSTIDEAPALVRPLAPPPVAPTDSEPRAVGEDVEVYLAQVTLVKDLLGIEEITPESLREIVRLAERGTSTAEAVERVTRKLEERRVRIADLEFERDLARETCDDQELELTDALSAQAKLADEVRWLRGRLAEQGDIEGSYGELPDAQTTRYPVDFSEVAEMLPGLEGSGVVFTGDLDALSSLMDHDHVGRIAGVTWQCLLVLSDYVRARSSGDHSQGLRQYLETTPQGYRGLPRKKFAAKETGATMRAWGDLRCFPVPLSVDPSGEARMEAHFKLGKVGMVSPRMYYLDMFATDGNVYVGYIGAHLRNTQTN